MIICKISALGIFLYLTTQVSGQTDDALKRGAHPYMAFVYYSDDHIREKNGTARFFRAAVLVKPHYLLSAAIDPVNETAGFPRKTLLARLGAISVDDTLSLNEDEGEQEKEVIQIIRPHNHTVDKWWSSDICILKVLIPFNITPAVNVTSLSTSHLPLAGKSCSILVFSKKEPTSTESLLWKWPVENWSKNDCGDHFESDRMICSTGFEKKPDHEQFCHDNIGGPLICDDEVVGLQSYFGTDCKPPYIYQRLSFWQTFLGCGLQDECHKERCQNVCTTNDKDEPVNTPPVESVKPVTPTEAPPMTEEPKAAPSEETRLEPAVDALQDASVITIPPVNESTVIEPVAKPIRKKLVRRHRTSGADQVAEISIRLFFWNLLFMMLS